MRARGEAVPRAARCAAAPPRTAARVLATLRPRPGGARSGAPGGARARLERLKEGRLRPGARAGARTGAGDRRAPRRITRAAAGARWRRRCRRHATSNSRAPRTPRSFEPGALSRGCSRVPAWLSSAGLSPRPRRVRASSIAPAPAMSPPPALQARVAASCSSGSPCSLSASVVWARPGRPHRPRHARAQAPLPARARDRARPRPRHAARGAPGISSGGGASSGVRGRAAPATRPDASVDVVFSSLMLQWCEPLDRALASVAASSSPTASSPSAPSVRTHSTSCAARGERRRLTNHVNHFVDVHEVVMRWCGRVSWSPVLDVDRVESATRCRCH